MKNIMEKRERSTALFPLGRVVFISSDIVIVLSLDGDIWKYLEIYSI